MLRQAAALVLLAVVAAGARAAPDPFDLRVTEEVSTGSYAEPAGLPVQQTTLRLRYRAERWQVQADVPWLRVVGARQAPLPPGARTDTGLGDLRLRLAVPLRAPSQDTSGLDLVLRLRGGGGTAVGGIAPGDAGQSLQLRIERPIGAWTAFGHLGVRRAGDLPGSDAARHAWVGEIGASRMLAHGIEAGAFFDLRQHMAESAALPEATLYAGFDVGDWRWDFFVGRVFHRDSAEPSAGVSLRGRF